MGGAPSPVGAPVGLPPAAPLFPAKALARRLPLTPETRTGSLGYDEQSLVWYLRAVVRPFHVRLRPEEVERFLAAPGPAICVVAQEELRRVRLDPAYRLVSYRGVNFARWKVSDARVGTWRTRLPRPQPVSLIAVLKPEER